jgi:hypothetical protein
MLLEMRDGQSVPLAPAIVTASAAESGAAAGEIAELERAFHDWVDKARPPLTSNKQTLLTISRHEPDDFQDRQIYLFVDGRAWGKIRYGQTVSRPVSPGRHEVRAFNTLFSKTLHVTVRPAEHVRLRCANGFPAAGWLMFILLHVTYLFVRLEREQPSQSGPHGGPHHDRHDRTTDDHA